MSLGDRMWTVRGLAKNAGFESLKELKEGDEVRMAGVKIGEVQDTRLSGSGRRAQLVRARLLSTTMPSRRSTSAA